MTVVRTPIAGDILDSLESFGFTRHQARVYAELVALGPTTAGPLVKRSGLHRQYVYSALEVLEEQQFASHVMHKGRRMYSAARPETLVQRQVERLRKMQLAVPMLQRLAPRGGPHVNIEVLTGRDEFIRRLFIAVDSAARCDGVIRLIADVRDKDVYAVIGPHYPEYADYVRRKKVRKRLIAPITSTSEGYRDRFVKETGAELRILDSSISTPTATIMTQELVILDIFGEEVISILVWSRSIARAFLQHFDVLWSASRRWKPDNLSPHSRARKKR